MNLKLFRKHLLKAPNCGPVPKEFKKEKRFIEKHAFNGVIGSDKEFWTLFHKDKNKAALWRLIFIDFLILTTNR